MKPFREAVVGDFTEDPELSDAVGPLVSASSYKDLVVGHITHLIKTRFFSIAVL